MRPWFQVSFNITCATPHQAMPICAMSSIREAVEWSYKDLKQMCSIQDYNTILNVRHETVSLMSKEEWLLWHFKVCLWNVVLIKSSFHTFAPTLHEYTGPICGKSLNKAFSQAKPTASPSPAATLYLNSAPLLLNHGVVNIY